MTNDPLVFCLRALFHRQHELVAAYRSCYNNGNANRRPTCQHYSQQRIGVRGVSPWLGREHVAVALHASAGFARAAVGTQCRRVRAALVDCPVALLCSRGQAGVAHVVLELFCSPAMRC